MSNVKEYLGQIVKMRNTCYVPDVMEYTCAEDFALRVGTNFSLKGITFPRTGVMKACFSNSFKMAIGNPDRYVYVEGFALSIIPTMHAWVWDREAKAIIDPTWEEGLEYVGTPIKIGPATKAMLSSGIVIGDWENKFPMLRKDIDLEEYIEKI